MAAVQPVDFDRLRIQRIILSAGEDVLRFILKWGATPPKPPYSLLDYLNSLPPYTNYSRITDNERHKVFTLGERKQIRRDLTYDTFDISLLCKVIKYSCKHVAEHNDDYAWYRDTNNTLERLITKIRQERNNVAHNKQLTLPNGFDAKVEQLRRLFFDVLDAAKTRYGISESGITQQEDNVKNTIKEVLQCFTKEDLLEKNDNEMFHMFKSRILSSLHNIFQNTQNIDPMSFLSDSPQTLGDMQHIFSKIVIKENQREVPHLEILGYTQSLGQPSQPHPIQPQQSTQPLPLSQSVKPQLTLLQGDAGCGKSTLLAYITSEWLKDPNNCDIKHLDQYDVILRILCRDTTASSLLEFVERVLPDADYFRHHTMKLIEKCKVLFLVDGLDERNSESRQLVQDILDRGQHVPGWSILCTSRPEAVTDFLRSAPTQYGKGEVVMEGISSNDRVDFIIQYLKCLRGTGSPSPDVVRQVEEIVWKKHFRLPINLLFLTEFILNNPSYVEQNTSLTSFYITMSEWTKEKLQQRLASHPKSWGIDRYTRREVINEVLHLIGKLALEGLLQNRLSLSEADKKQLRKCCRKLPSSEVLGAFYSVRSHIVDRKEIVTYYAPHKSIQEFNSAQYIVYKMQEGTSIKSVLQQCLDTSEDPTQLANLLYDHDTSRQLWTDESSKLTNLKNLLVHVLGLLCHPEPDMLPLPEPLQEVVDLLHKTGIKECNQWLTLLEDIEVNSIAVDRIAKHITTNNICDETVEISDTTSTSARSLLPRIPSKEVRIRLVRRSGHIRQLGQATANHTVTHLRLNHHYKTPDPSSTSDPILHDLPRRYLEVFRGHLSHEGLELLRECGRLKYLQLAISCDNDAPTILSTLHHILPSLPVLFHLCLHIPVKTVTPNVLTSPIPDITPGCFDLCGVVLLALSGVKEELISETSQIAAALQPRKHGYSAITFPDCQLKADGWRHLINTMADSSVRVVGDVCVPDTFITLQENEYLTILSNTRLSCRIVRMPEDRLWTYPLLPIHIYD